MWKFPAPWKGVAKHSRVEQGMRAAGNVPTNGDAPYIESRDDDVIICWIEEWKT